MRISDWSSDVCSSDLGTLHLPPARVHGVEQRVEIQPPQRPDAHTVHYVGEQGTLLRQNIVDPMFDGVITEIGGYLHRPGLSDPMRPVLGLRLERGVPPAVEMDHVRRPGQLEPDAPGAQPKQHTAPSGSEPEPG